MSIQPILANLVNQRYISKVLFMLYCLFSKTKQKKTQQNYIDLLCVSKFCNVLCLFSLFIKYPYTGISLCLLSVTKLVLFVTDVCAGCLEGTTI